MDVLRRTNEMKRFERINRKSLIKWDLNLIKKVFNSYLGLLYETLGHFTWGHFKWAPGVKRRTRVYFKDAQQPLKQTVKGNLN
jgi:hypothetical protein